jgi:hypothetical protein
MTSTFTTNKYLEEPGNGDYVNSWNVPNNANFSALDVALGGQTTLTVTGLSGVQTLTNTQYRPPYYYVTGTLTANVNWQLPAGVGGLWVVNNMATGGYSVTLSSAGGGSSAVIASGATQQIYSDGTNVALTSNVAATPGGTSGQVQYNNGGTFGGTAAITVSGTTATIQNLNLGAVLSVSNGGLGVGSLAANGIVVGNGTSAVSIINPGTANNVLTDTGTGFVSKAPLFTAGTVSSVSGGLTISSGVLSSPLTAGGVGTYTWGTPRLSLATTFNLGSTIAGSNLSNQAGVYPYAGTWQCMGYSLYSPSGCCGPAGQTASLWQRIA